MKTINTPEITYQSGMAVIHFLEIQESDWKTNGVDTISIAYDRAIKKAKPFGGKKWHCRSYGGGIAFSNAEDAVKCFRHFQEKGTS